VVSLTAGGYHGPGELTPLRALTEWAVDPWALAVLLLAGGAYLVGAGRVRRRGGHWPTSRIISFCAGGVGLAAIATSSSLAVYWPVLFYVRAIQTVVLLLAVPLFAALGRPLSLAIAVAPRLGPRLAGSTPVNPAPHGLTPHGLTPHGLTPHSPAPHSGRGARPIRDSLAGSRRLTASGRLTTRACLADHVHRPSTHPDAASVPATLRAPPVTTVRD
jgi:hypothetical protein